MFRGAVADRVLIDIIVIMTAATRLVRSGPARHHHTFGKGELNLCSEGRGGGGIFARACPTDMQACVPLPPFLPPSLPPSLCMHVRLLSLLPSLALSLYACSQDLSQDACSVTIYASTDGSDPTNLSSATHSGASPLSFQIQEGFPTTIKAVAVSRLTGSSAVSMGTFTPKASMKTKSREIALPEAPAKAASPQASPQLILLLYKSGHRVFVQQVTEVGDPSGIKDGIRRGDEIVSVNGQPVGRMELEDICQLFTCASMTKIAFVRLHKDSMGNEVSLLHTQEFRCGGRY
jgi:hypothetical protein